MSVLATQEPATSTVGPGAESATHTVRVRNRGDTVEEYQLSVLGPLASFAAITPEVIRLYPGDEGNATVVFTVPRAVDPPAGPTPFGVRVVPRVHPELSDVVEGSITITGFAEMRADLRPPLVRGRLAGSLGVTVENRGNTPLDVELVGRDQEDLLRFGGPDGAGTAVRVAPGATAPSSLRVRPRRRKLVGRVEQRIPFTLTVTPSPEAEAAGAQPVVLSGAFVRRPLIRRWQLLLLVAALVVALVAGGVGYLTASPLRLSLPDLSSFGLGRRSPPSTAPAPPAGQAPARSGQGQGGGGTGGGGAVVIEHDGRALTAGADAGRDEGAAPVTTQPGGGGSRQLREWVLLRARGGVVVIVSRASQRALEQPDGTSVTLGRPPGSNVGREQAWQLRPAGDGGTAIVNVASGDCLTDTGADRPVTASRCGGDAQAWSIAGS